ncbi:unnamed protein product, partial [Closterium sp. NIES-53]
RSLARGASPAPFPLSPPLPSFLPLSPPVGLSPRAPSLERHVHDHQRLQELQQEDHRRSLLSRWARGVWWGCGPLRRLPTHPPLMPTSSHSPLPVPRFRAIPQYLPAGGAVDPFRALPTHPPHTPTSSHSPLPVPRFQGYPPVPPRWRGKCTTTSDFKACSKKIIGAHYFAEGLVASGGSVDPSAEYLSPRDASDHGTWCAGAAAGNPVKVSGGGVQFGTASGMAPRARIAVYKAIWVQGKLAIGSDSDVFAAVDRAVADGVDVLSMSVAINEETYFKHLAMLRAARAGVFVSLVAGNSGLPPASPKLYRTLTNLSPYYITVAASTSSQAWPPQARLSLGNRQSYLGETLLGGSTATRQLPLVDGKSSAAAGYTASQAEACVPYSLAPSKVRSLSPSKSLIPCLCWGATLPRAGCLWWAPRQAPPRLRHACPTLKRPPR